jgi:hypothetical protein
MAGYSGIRIRSASIAGERFGRGSINPKSIPPPDIKTKDHIVPQSQGGTKIVTSCLGCNRDKKDLSLDEYRLIRAFRAGMIRLPEYKFAAEQRI